VEPGSEAQKVELNSYRPCRAQCRRRSLGVDRTLVSKYLVLTSTTYMCPSLGGWRVGIETHRCIKWKLAYSFPESNENYSE
jgi:hypothetical protein